MLRYNILRIIFENCGCDEGVVSAGLRVLVEVAPAPRHQ